MSVTAGTLSKVLIGQTTAQLLSAAATAGTGPYTYQWYRSQTSSFTPGAGNLLAGQTALSLSDSGLNAGQTYYYLVVATDTGASNATSQSAQLTVALQPALNQNQFQMQAIVGIIDQKIGPTNIIPCLVDASVSGSIQVGQGVKIVAQTVGGTPHIAPVSSKSDACFGNVIFNSKDIQYVAGQFCEVAIGGTIIWLYATSAITQFAEVCLDPTYVGGVQPSGNSATLMGQAFDGCAAAGLIRVQLFPNVNFATA